MKIITIDWERKIIEEVETDSVQYNDDGISYTCYLSTNVKTTRTIPYRNFLGIKEN